MASGDGAAPLQPSGKELFTTKWFMILRTPTENENASPTNPMDVMLSEAKHLLFR